MTGTILKLGNEELNDDELNEEELRDCLKAFDSEGNGSVPVAELRKALAKWTQLENAEVDDVIDGIIEPNGRLMNIEKAVDKLVPKPSSDDNKKAKRKKAKSANRAAFSLDQRTLVFTLIFVTLAVFAYFLVEK